MKNHLKNLRDKNDLSQEKLAEELNVSRQTIISLEKERYNPSLQLAFLIAKRFECKIEDIFIYKGEEND